MREDTVTAAAHNDKVFRAGFFAQQIGFVKEDGIALAQAVIAAEFTNALLQRHFTVMDIAGHIGVYLVGKAHEIGHMILLGFQTLQNLGKDLGIVIVDVQSIGQRKADIRAGAAIGAADADHQMVALAKAVAQAGGVQAGHLLVQNIHTAKAGGQAFHFLQDRVIFAHQAGAGGLVLNGAGHVADQCQLAAQIMAFFADAHQAGQFFNGGIALAGENPAQTGAQAAVNLAVQLINAGSQCNAFFTMLFHVQHPLIRRKSGYPK